MALVTYNATLVEWENIIRVKLKVTNPSLLKSGSLGILTNYLAGIKYDTLQFYTKIFQEMNVGLAQDFNSMLYHSSVYGTELEFAVPSILNSAIIIPEIALGNTSQIIYTIPRYSSFIDANGFHFIFESEIRFEVNSSRITATAWNPQYGTRTLTITKTNNPNIPGTNIYLIHNSDALQYRREFYLFEVPQYDVGDTYDFSIAINEVSSLKGLQAWLNTGDSINQSEIFKFERIDPEEITGYEAPDRDLNLTDLNIRYYKFDSSVRDQDIFLEITENSLNFETGNGTHGMVLPAGAQILIEIQKTDGVSGNVPNSEYLLPNISVTEKFSSGLVD
jgi:hypothetical protein